MHSMQQLQTVPHLHSSNPAGNFPVFVVRRVFHLPLLWSGIPTPGKLATRVVCCLPEETRHAVGVRALHVGEATASLQPTTRLVCSHDPATETTSSLRCMCPGGTETRPCQPHSPNTRKHTCAASCPHNAAAGRCGTSLLRLWSPHGQRLFYVTVASWGGAAVRAVSASATVFGLREVLRQQAAQMPTTRRPAYVPSLRQVVSSDEELSCRGPHARLLPELCFARFPLQVRALLSAETAGGLPTHPQSAATHTAKGVRCLSR